MGPNYQWHHLIACAMQQPNVRREEKTKRLQGKTGKVSRKRKEGKWAIERKRKLLWGRESFILLGSKHGENLGKRAAGIQLFKTAAIQQQQSTNCKSRSLCRTHSISDSGRTHWNISIFSNVEMCKTSFFYERLLVGELFEKWVFLPFIPIYTQISEA